MARRARDASASASTFVPALLHAGLDQQEIDQLPVANPAALTGRS